MRDNFLILIKNKNIPVGHGSVRYGEIVSLAVLVLGIRFPTVR
jgi:hypothetical protein